MSLKYLGCLLYLILYLDPLSGQEEGSKLGSREKLDLYNFLDTRLVPGYNLESDVTFPFWKGTFPTLDVNSPATVSKFMGGEYQLDVRWFDTYLNEVDTLLQPGRYGYYAEVKGINGITLKRAGTMFCTPNDWMVWSEWVRAPVDYFPFDNIPRSIWEENKEAITGYGGHMVLESILNHRHGGILLSFIHDMNLKSLTPGPYHTPIIMDGNYHVALKRKVTQTGDQFKSFEAPIRTSRTAPVLRSMNEDELEHYTPFVAEMETLCREWAEKGGEPFDILVAKDGIILFHGAFGENLRGEFAMDEPNEIASITKLYTGLLFAQFMDQGIIGADDPVGMYLTDFKLEGNQAITMRQCFTHTAGFSGHGSMGGVQNPWLDNSLALWLPYLEPGTYHRYNGMGYNLAGKIMEIASGKSIFHLMHEYLFAPLDLQHTYLDYDLAYGIKSTAFDMAVVGQMLLNKGTYGDFQFFSEDTYEALLPVDLEKFYPQIRGRTWGIGITSMNQYEENKETGERRALLSDKILGHGSATSSILNVDPENRIVFTQSRMSGGLHFKDYVLRAYKLFENYLTDTP